jgi:hypothetical protein
MEETMTADMATTMMIASPGLRVVCFSIKKVILLLTLN